MRITTVRVRGDDGRIFRSKVLAAKCLEDPLGHLVLMSPAVADPLANGLKRLSGDAVDRIPGEKVTGDLLVIEHGFELAHQIAGADNVHAETAHQLDGAGVH